MVRLLALAAVPLALGLRGPAKTYDPPVGMEHPDVIVGGVGNAGTTAVIKGLQDLGLKYCRWHDKYDEPVLAHQGRPELIKAFLAGGRREMTREAYMKSPQAWLQAIALQQKVAQKEAWCVLKGKEGLRVPENYSSEIDKYKPWGYMEAHYSWLLPVLDETFNNRTNYLLVARDPRDVCNNTHELEQFTYYGWQMNMTDCYVWWASYWDQVFTHYGHSENVKIVRIEDLAMHEPKQDEEALAVVRCMAKHAGLDRSNEALLAKPKPLLPLFGKATSMSLLRREELNENRTGAMEELKHFQKSMRGYMHLREHVKTKASKEDNLVFQTGHRYAIYSTMMKLGYNPIKFEKMSPTHPRVCSS